jgi:hypothetical protein
MRIELLSLSFEPRVDSPQCSGVALIIVGGGFGCACRGELNCPGYAMDAEGGLGEE